MGNDQRIAVPWSRRLSRFRDQYLPVITFAVCVSIMLWLWGRHVGYPHADGEVYPLRVELAASQNGLLGSWPGQAWEPLDWVGAGQVVARLDDRAIMANLSTLKTELARLQAELPAEKARLQWELGTQGENYLSDLADLATQVEQLRLAQADRKATTEIDQVQLQRLRTKLDALQSLKERGYASELEVMDAQMEHDVVAQRIESTNKTMEEVQAQLETAQKRFEEFPETPKTMVDSILAPLREQINVQQALIRELELQIEMLEIRSPISGAIEAIYAQPGQAVLAGAPILTIASDQSEYLIAYLRQDQHLKPQIGMRVRVRPRSPKQAAAESRVEEVGAQFAPIPVHQLRRSDTPEWGLAVRIAVPQELNLRPGEIADITFLPN